MRCDICSKDLTFLYFIGKNNICPKCIAKHTVFKEVKESEDSLLRKALRSFNIKSFDDLRHITEQEKELLVEGKIKEKRKKTFQVKKNKIRGKRIVDEQDYLDLQSELDIDY